MFELTKNDKKKILQCYVMGNISTKMNKKNPSIIKSIPIVGSYIERKIAIKPDYIAKQVIMNLNESKNNIFFFPFRKLSFFFTQRLIYILGVKTRNFFPVS